MKESIDYWRQLDIIQPSELPSVTMIGAGGIGSFTLLALAKMGVGDLTVFDKDLVDTHNIPNQLYPLSAVGLPKGEAASAACKEFGGVGVRVVHDFVTKGMTTKLHGVVISGVDSMKARGDIWSQVKNKPAVELYIDARMGAEVCRIYTIKPCTRVDVEFYEQFLYDDSEALEEPCTAKAVIYNGLSIAALVASQVKKHSKGEAFPKEIIFDMKTLTLITT